MNPADFFMLEISAMKEQEGYKTPLNSTNYKAKELLLKDYSLNNQDECNKLQNF